jgi:tetratricopeptide (TPR) repeat protein
MPGLEKVGDPAVRLALSRGDGQALYDALGRLVRDRAGTAEATQAQAWLPHRRLFLWPYKRAPSLHRVNGVGAGLYGSSEKDPSDGTYIATYCASFVFFPVFPIGQYLVRDAGGNSYNIFGKIPVSSVVRLWRKAFGLGALAAAGLIALGVVRSHHTAHVQLVNGLTIPVEVSIAGTTGWVLPGTHVERTLKAGKTEIVARDKSKRVVEQLSVDLPGATDVVAYNVLGAAPLYAEGVVYYASGSSDKDKHRSNPVITYGGDSFVFRDHIQYIFKKPPETIQMEGSTETRWAFQLLPDGLLATLGMLEEKKQERRAAEVARKVALAAPITSHLQAAARYMDGGAAIESLAHEIVDAHPESGDAQRFYQDVLRSLGKLKEAEAHAKAVRDKDPEAALGAYLLARLMPFTQALPAFLKVVEQHPDDPDALRGASYELFVARRFKEALALYDRWLKIDPAGAGPALTWHVCSAIGAGDLPGALRLAAAGAQSERIEDQPIHRAILYGQVAHLAGKAAPYPAHYFLERQLKTTGPWVRAWFTASLGRAPGAADLARSPEHVRRGVQMIEALRHDPSRAVELLDQASAKQLVGYDPLGALLLALELERTGDKSRAQLLLAPLSGYPLDDVRRYVKTGQESDELKESDLYVQAVARFMRARSLEAAHKPADALYRAAAADDLLGATIADAEQAWPHPQR